MSNENKTDWGAIALIAAVGIGGYLLLRNKGSAIDNLLPGGGTGINISTAFPPLPYGIPAFPELSLENPVTACETCDGALPPGTLPDSARQTIADITGSVPAISIPGIPELNIPTVNYDPGAYNIVQGSTVNIAGSEYGVIPRIPGFNISHLEFAGRMILDALNPFQFGLLGAIGRHVQYGSPVIDTTELSKPIAAPWDNPSESPSFTPAGKEPTAIEKRETETAVNACESGSCGVGAEKVVIPKEIVTQTERPFAGAVATGGKQPKFALI